MTSGDDDFDPWWRQGICAEIGPDLFFVGKGQSVIEAQQACRICPVRLKCLIDSLESHVDYGVFGGFAPPMRQMLQVQLKHGTRDSTEVAKAAIHKDMHQRRRATWR